MAQRGRLRWPGLPLTGQRIVSLLPSATEIVYALGLEDRLVGVTFECDEPARARRDKAVVVGGRDTSVMTPREIDDYVKAAAASGTDLYTLQAQALRELSPDLVLTQDLCRVCAVPSASVAEALEHLGSRAEVLSLDPHSLEEVLATVLAVGQAAVVQDRAQALVAGLQARLHDVSRAVAGRPRPRVAVIEWVDPPYAAGHWVPDLVAAAGGEPVGARPGERSVETTWAQVVVDAPDVVLVAPCGFGLDAALAQADAVRGHLPAATIWAIDANSFVVRPGPRLVDGVEAISWALHPEVAPPPPVGRVQRLA